MTDCSADVWWNCLRVRMYVRTYVHTHNTDSRTHKADIMHAAVSHLGVGEHGGETFLKTGQLLILQAAKHKDPVLHAQHEHKHHLQDTAHIQSTSRLRMNRELAYVVGALLTLKKGGKPPKKDTLKY